MTIMAPEVIGESLDPRDPLLRLRTFFDDNSVELLHERDQSGILAAAGTVNGLRINCPIVASPPHRLIASVHDDPQHRRGQDGQCRMHIQEGDRQQGGAMGVDGCRHIVEAYDLAIAEQGPIVGIWHSGGARLAEGVKGLHAVGLVFEAMIRASGYIPQISVVVGFAAGGAAYGPALRHRTGRGPQCDR